MMGKTAAMVAGFGAVVLMVAGCSEHQHYFSGFLKDYSKLTPSPVDQVALSYRNPDADFTRYDKIHVQPVSVHFANLQDEAAVSAERLEVYKQTVRDAPGKYDLDSGQPGENVAELRFQVANVRLTRAIESPTTTIRTLRYQMGSANGEAELVDERTGVVLRMYIGDTVTPKGVETWSEQDAWESLLADTRRAVKRWVSTWAPKFAAASHPTRASNDEEEVE